GDTRRSGGGSRGTGTIGTKSEPSAPRPWSQMTEVLGDGPVSTSRPSDDSRTGGRPSLGGGGAINVREAPGAGQGQAAARSRGRFSGQRRQRVGESLRHALEAG